MLVRALVQLCITGCVLLLLLAVVYAMDAVYIEVCGLNSGDAVELSQDYYYNVNCVNAEFYEVDNLFVSSYIYELCMCRCNYTTVFELMYVRYYS